MTFMRQKIVGQVYLTLKIHFRKEIDKCLMKSQMP